MKGLYHASGSMLVNQTKLEHVSNALSNLNTPGFKRSEVVTQSFPEMLLYRLEGTPAGRKIAQGPVGTTVDNIAVEEIPLLHEPGSLLDTGRELDVALQGAGFFAVETPAGERYTRNGHFHIDGAGMLVTSDGHYVQGEEGPIELNSDRPRIDAQGWIYEEDEEDPVARLQVMHFEEEELLFKEDSGLYQAQAGAAVLEEEEYEVRQGYLEDSNADLSRQMTNMIRLRRSYEASQRISQAYDSMLSRAANELASLR